MTKLKSLSLFLPVHNEEASLDVLLKQALEVLPQVARRFEILVIDDGSTDGSAAVAKRFAKKHTQIKLISHQGNLGYGEVLKTGIAAAQYDWIFWTDADLQFDLREIGHFVAAAATEQNAPRVGNATSTPACSNCLLMFCFACMCAILIVLSS